MQFRCMKNEFFENDKKIPPIPLYLLKLKGLVIFLRPVRLIWKLHGKMIRNMASGRRLMDDCLI